MLHLNKTSHFLQKIFNAAILLSGLAYFCAIYGHGQTSFQTSSLNDQGKKNHEQSISLNQSLKLDLKKGSKQEYTFQQDFIFEDSPGSFVIRVSFHPGDKFKYKYDDDHYSQ